MVVIVLVEVFGMRRLVRVLIVLVLFYSFYLWLMVLDVVCCVFGWFDC